MNWFDVDLAFTFVSNGPYGSHRAFVNRETGEVYLESEDGDLNELPEDVDDDPRYLAIPHKNDLDLGKHLVQRFVRENLPDHQHQVDKIFRNKGAYSHYKELLRRAELLDKWHAFEQSETELALREWCAHNNLVIEESDRTNQESAPLKADAP